MTGLIIIALLAKASEESERKQKQEIQDIAQKVTALVQRMHNATLPEYGPFTRGGTNSIIQAETIIENHLSMLKAIQGGESDEHWQRIDDIIRSIVAIKTLKDSIGKAEQRAESILSLAQSAGYPEAEYVIYGIYGDENKYVSQVREMAGFISFS